MISSIFAERATGLLVGMSQPLTPSIICSSAPPERVARTGLPSARASAILSPKASKNEEEIET